MRLYVAGPMRGIEDFNFPAFHAAAERLRAAGHEVFNPAERDIEAHGADVCKSSTGDLADIAHLGFDLRVTLAADLEWICRHAEGVATLPGWERSSGATAERAVGKALGLKVGLVEEFL